MFCAIGRERGCRDPCHSLWHPRSIRLTLLVHRGAGLLRALSTPPRLSRPAMLRGWGMAAKKKAAKKKAAKRKAAPKKRAPRIAETLSDVKAMEREAMGRPTKFTPEVAEAICFRLSMGMSLFKACSDDDMPHHVTVRRWVLGQGGIPASEVENFRSNYEAARQAQAEAHFEELYEDATNVLPETGHVGAGKLKADAIKWRLARMNRAKYGDKADLNIGGQGDAPPVQTEQAVDLTSLTPEERKELQRIAQRTITGKE